MSTTTAPVVIRHSDGKLALDLVPGDVFVRTYSNSAGQPSAVIVTVLEIVENELATEYMTVRYGWQLRDYDASESTCRMRRYDWVTLV